MLQLYMRPINNLSNNWALQELWTDSKLPFIQNIVKLIIYIYKVKTDLPVSLS